MLLCRGRVSLVLAILAIPSILPAQDTRTATIEHLRAERAASLRPYEPGRCSIDGNRESRPAPIRVPSRATRAPIRRPPAAFPADAEFVPARVRALHPDRPAWGQPLVVYFRRTVSTWTLVGLERNP